MQNSMITSGNWNGFLTLKDEQLLLVKRKHPFVLFMPFFLIGCLTVFFVSTAYVVFQDFINSPSLFFTTTLLLVSIAFSLVTKSIIDWYFHVYILTTRKLIERRYTPLISFIANDILLDRVNCTEIDLINNGFFNEIIDMGDILIAFDRPTRQEEFILKDIKGSHELVTYLTQQLIDGNQSRPNLIQNTIWFKQHTASGINN